LAFRHFIVPATSRRTHHQAIFTERLLTKENSRLQAQRTIKLMVCKLRIKLWWIDSKLFQQIICHPAVGSGAVDEEGAAIQDLESTTEVKLIPLGMTSEVVVILKNENAS